MTVEQIKQRLVEILKQPKEYNEYDSGYRQGITEALSLVEKQLTFSKLFSED